MTGERSERWYLGAEHSMALTTDLWLRGRWYDTGEPTAAILFGDTLEDRYPGAVYRHASLEGDHGILGYNFQSSSLLTDGALARSDVPGTNLERDAVVVRLGPGGGSLWRVGIQAEDTRFDGGERRTLVIPALALRIPGPWKLAGSIEGRGIIGTNGEGSREDEAYIFSLAEKIAVESSGDWGRHSADLELTASVAQGAAFGGSVLRDSKDLVQERRIIDARVHSLLTSSRFRWDLTAGSWQDQELDLVLNYGITSLNYSGMFMNVSKNRDADFGLVLPSLAVDGDSLRGWQVEAGYESEALGFAVGRDSAEGFPEVLRARGRFTLAGVSVSVKSFYDMDADKVADETITVEIPGRCWTVGVERSRSPDKTGWSVQLELGI
jgi:hypothetical protein